eukprot:5980791-Pleurochrysis_carterae.AAC.1
MRSVPTAARTTSSVYMRAVCMRASSTPRYSSRSRSHARVARLLFPTSRGNSRRKMASRMTLRRWA